MIIYVLIYFGKNDDHPVRNWTRATENNHELISFFIAISPYRWNSAFLHFSGSVQQFAVLRFRVFPELVRNLFSVSNGQIINLTGYLGNVLGGPKVRWVSTAVDRREAHRWDDQLAALAPEFR